MKTLQDFLNSNPIDNITSEVAVSDRFKDDEGKLFKFKIKAMNNKTFEDLRKRSMKMKGRTFDLDSRAYNLSIVIENTLEPDFKDADSLAKMGCANPEQYVERVLLAGEINTLADEITKLSGFDTSMEDLVEEAKN